MSTKLDFDVLSNNKAIKDLVENDSNKDENSDANGEKFKFKERILCTVVEPDEIKSTNFYLNNRNYYENYFEFVEDFECSDFSYAMSKKKECLKSQPEVPGKDKASKADAPYSIKEENVKDYILSISQSLEAIFLSNTPNNETKCNTIIRLLDNILLNFNYSFKHYNVFYSSEIEKKFDRIIDNFEKTFFETEKLEKRTIEMIDLLMRLFFKLSSSYLCIKMLKIIHKKKLSLDNFSAISKEIEKDISGVNLINFREREEKQLRRKFETKIINHAFVADNRYLYLFTKCSFSWSYTKINLKKNAVDFYDIIDLHADRVKLIFRKNQNEIILLGNTNNKFEIYSIDVESSSFKKKSELNLNKESLPILAVFSDDTNFYLVHGDSKSKEISVYHSDTDKTGKIKYSIPSDFLLKKSINEDSAYYNVANEFIVFPSSYNMTYYSISEKRFHKITNSSNSKLSTIGAGSKTFFNHEKGVLILSRVEEGAVNFKMLVNLSIHQIPLGFESQLLLNICNKIREAKAGLEKEFPHKEEEFEIDNYFLNDCHVKKKEVRWGVNKKYQSYFDYLYFNIVKYFILFGDLHQHEKKRKAFNYPNITENKIIEKTYKKTFAFNLYNDLLLNLAYEDAQKQEEPIMKNSALIMIKSTIDFFIKVHKRPKDSNFDIREYYPKVEEIFDFLYKELRKKNEIARSIFLTLNEGNNFIKKYADEFKAQILSESTPIDTVLILFDVMLNSQMDIHTEIIEGFVNNEIKLISQSALDKECCNKMAKLQKLLTEKIRLKIKAWSPENLKSESDPITKIFNIVLSGLMKITDFVKKNIDSIDSLIIQKSFTCNIFLTFIFLILTKEKSNDFFYEYFEKVLPLISQLNEIFSLLSHSNLFLSHNLLEEEDYLIESWQSPNADNPVYKQIEFKNTNKSIVQFSSASSIKEPGKVSINKYGPFSTNIPSKKIIIKSNLVTVNYSPQDPDAKVLNNEEHSSKDSSHGFSLKISNHDNSRFDDNILTEVQRVLLYSFNSLLTSKIKSIKAEEKGQKNNTYVLNSFFNSSLFENISIGTEDKKLDENGEKLKKIYSDEKYKRVAEQYAHIESKLNLFSMTYEENQNIKDIINKFKNIDSDERYKVAVQGLHEQFLLKNKWGNILESRLKKLVVMMLGVVLKNEKMVLAFDEFVQAQQAQKDITAIKNYNYFISIYTKISEVKKWFQQKIINITELVDKEAEKEEFEISTTSSKEDAAIETFIKKITNKAMFLLDSIREQVNKKSTYNEKSINDTVENLLKFIESDDIEISGLIKKIKLQNAYAIEKEKALNFFNRLLLLVTTNQEQKYIISYINKLTKDKVSRKSFLPVNHDLYGANTSYIYRIKMQIYTYILIVISKIKEVSDVSKTPYDIMYYYTLLDGLVWMFKKKDLHFLQVSKVFELFNESSLIANIIKCNPPFTKGQNTYNIATLQRKCFDVFSALTYTIFDKINNLKEEEMDRRNLFKRKSSDMDENELFSIIYSIGKAIIGVMDTYIQKMKKFVDELGGEKPSVKLESEEKLNDYLILLYRALSLNNKMIGFFINKYPNFFCTLLFIFFYSSEKNKYISMKLIKIFSLFEGNEKFLENSLKNFRSKISKHLEFYNLIETSFTSKKEDLKDDYTFYFTFLFVYSALLMKEEGGEEHYYFKTECDNLIAYEIVLYLREIFMKEHHLSDKLIAYMNLIIKEMVASKNKASDSIFDGPLFLTLGYEVNPIRLGASIIYDISKGDKILRIPKANLFLSEDQNDELKSYNLKEGIIIGFGTAFTNIFNFSTEFEREVPFEIYHYFPKKYIYVVLKESLNKNSLTSMNFNTMMFDQNEIRLKKVNLFENTTFVSKIKTSLLLDTLAKNYSNLSPRNQFFTLSLIQKAFLSKLMKQSIAEVINSVKSLKKSILNNSKKNLEQPLLPLEFLENLAIPLILSCNSKIDETHPQDEKIDTSKKEASKQDDRFFETPPQVFLHSSSVFIRYSGQDLFKEIPYVTIYNNLFFKVSDSFIPVLNYGNENGEIKTESSLMVDKEVLSSDLRKIEQLVKNSKNFITSIITNGKVKKEEMKPFNIPIIEIPSIEFQSALYDLFSPGTNPSMDFENLYLASTNDFTSLIEIPPEMISLDLNPRDLVLKALNEEAEPGRGGHLKSATAFSKKKFSKSELGKIYNNLICLLSRRLWLTSCDSELPLYLIKLAMLEINVYRNSQDPQLNTIKEKNKIELIEILKQYLRKISTGKSLNDKYIKELLSFDFLKNKEFFSKVMDVSVFPDENNLLKKESAENNLNLIFYVMSFIKNDKSVLAYKMNLFTSLVDRVAQLDDTFSLYSFIFDILLNYLKDFNNQLSEEGEKQKELIEIINLKKETLFLEGPKSLLPKVEEYFELNKENSLSTYESKMVNFFFLLLDIGFKLQQEGVDVNLKPYFDTKLFNIYSTYVLLKKEKNLAQFILFQLKRNLLPSSKFSTHEFSSYDEKFEIPHVVEFNSRENEEIDYMNIIVKHISPELIGPLNNIFIFEDPHCNNLQDYINIRDVGKKIQIKNANNNRCYISFPNKNFKNYLYGCGSNEKNSLGFNGTLDRKYLEPKKCEGLDDAKNFKDFKFGYFHTFVHTIEGDLYTCGSDSGGGFKSSESHPIFTKETHFHSLGKEKGIRGIWVNNFNATIMLTESNELYACGQNNEYCLTDAIEKNTSASIPFQLPVIRQKILQVACGFQSSFFLLEDGSAMTVGSNGFHQCGSMEDVGFYKKYYHLKPPSRGKFKSVVAGEEYFLIIVDEENNHGRLYTMGSNDTGKAGVGRENSNRLQKCKGVEHIEFKVISSRNNSSAAISSNGELYTFGFNAEGCLGQGNTLNYYKPTKVEYLSHYICDDVGISNNHMFIVARYKKSGKKTLLSCGTNEQYSLGFKVQNSMLLTPTENRFFSGLKLTPVKVSLSRYQSFIMTVENKINKEMANPQFYCSLCSSRGVSISNYQIYINNKEKKNNLPIYFCLDCYNKKFKQTKNVFYTIQMPTLNFLKFNDFPNCKEILKETEKEDKNNTAIQICRECSDEIPVKNGEYVSLVDLDLTLCHNCFSARCQSIKYPQVFLCFVGIKPNKDILSRKRFPYNEMYPSIKHSRLPYLAFDLEKVYTKYERFRSSFQSKDINSKFSSFWKKVSNKQLIELNKLKEQIDEVSKKNKEINFLPSGDAFSTFEILHKMLDEEKARSKKSSELSSEIQLSKKYSHLIDLKFDEFNLIYELSDSLNEGIFELINVSNNFSGLTFFNRMINENLDIISSKERLNIFNDKLDKLKLKAKRSEFVVELSRIKAARFYEKNIPDHAGNQTVFGQLYNKMKSYPISDYLSESSTRLFTVTLLGEGSTDYGGPYNDVLSTICEELQSKYLDLFIKTDNNQGEIGKLREKFVPNPNAKTAVQMDMYYFLGCLLGHAISSGNLLNLNFHPIVWSKIITIDYFDFNLVESIDKLFYKQIIAIEKFKGTEKEFNDLFPDYNFEILLSDKTPMELKPNGKDIQVTYSNKDEYVKLAKIARVNEFNLQINSIRNGLINVIPENILSLLTWKELEEQACGEPTIDINILRQFTEYQGFKSDSPTIQNFWNVLKEFSNEDKVLYLKYVWGRSRIPNPNVFKFIQVIAKLNSLTPDKKLPTATTCYFTLKLPDYSTKEILREKLLYVIKNCSEIDTDFTVSANEYE